MIDETTNHLDMGSVEALAARSRTNTAHLLVTLDRHLIDREATGELENHEGGLINQHLGLAVLESRRLAWPDPGGPAQPAARRGQVRRRAPAGAAVTRGRETARRRAGAGRAARREAALFQAERRLGDSTRSSPTHTTATATSSTGSRRRSGVE